MPDVLVLDGFPVACVCVHIMIYIYICVCIYIYMSIKYCSAKTYVCLQACVLEWLRIRSSIDFCRKQLAFPLSLQEVIAQGKTPSLFLYLAPISTYSYAI